MTRSVARDVRSIVLALLAIAWLAGCDEGGEADAGPTRDAASADAGAIRDGGSTSDGGSDAGSHDAGSSDAGAESDASVDDAGASDAGAESDAGVDDAGASDAGAESDAGTDAAALGPEPGPGDLVIVEIQGNPQVATDEQAEYIEVLNVSGRTLDLEGCRITQWTGVGPVVGGGNHLIDASVVIAPGDRALLARSSGGFFGGATRDYVYDGFVFSNGGADMNRLRIMAPSWDGADATAAPFIVDEVIAPPGTFDNDLRGRAWQLDPARVPTPTAAGNDDPADWCHAAAIDALAYRASNWGTPRADNRCD